MKNLPLASFLLTQILGRVTIKHQIKPLDFEILRVKSGGQKTKSYYSLKNIKVSDFISVLRDQYGLHVDVDCVKRKAVIERYGITLTIYETMLDSCDVELVLPQNDEDDVTKSVATIIKNVLADNRHEIQETDVMLLRTSIEEIVLDVDVDEPLELIVELCNSTDIMRCETKEDRGNPEYDLITLDLGLITLKVNNSVNNNREVILVI